MKQKRKDGKKEKEIFKKKTKIVFLGGCEEISFLIKMAFLEK